MTELNLKYKIINLLEDNVRQNLDKLRYSDTILYTTPAA